MDLQTAQQTLVTQTLPQYETETTFLSRLRQGQPPVPGQVTSILLALKVVHGALQGQTTLNRVLAHALFLLTYESRNLFEAQAAAGTNWPLLLDEDLERIAIAAYKIFIDAPVEEG